MNKSGTEIADTKWNGLYKVGGAAALIAIGIVVIEAIVVIAWPPPDTLLGRLTFFQNNRLIGLIDYMLLDAAVMVFLGPMFLALYIALRRANETWMTVATPLAFVGIAAYVSANNSFPALFLSDEYSAATSDAQRSLILSAGEALHAIIQNGMFYSMGFLLVAIAGLIIAVVMLRSNVFSRIAAYVGIFANALTLANFISFAFLPAASIVPTIFFIGGAFLTFTWWILVGLRLYKLGRFENKMLPQSS